ncbi:VG15 protein [Streptosporangium sandarakinum]
MADDVAAAHYRAQQQISRQVAEQAQQLWTNVEASNVLESWLAQLATMIQALTGGQAAAAAMAQPYVEALATAQDIPSVPAGVVNPGAFAGLAADGRDLANLLVQPALRTIGLLVKGADDQDALKSGLASLVRIVDTEVSDASRAADHVGMVANRGWATYVRHVSLPACGRCIILAGREYSWSTGFLRHPRCDCTMVPRRAGEERPAAPDELFEQMSEDEQAKAFGSAGAEAIRLGADMGQVVNARRGMQTVAGKLVTTEGTTSRGAAGRKLGNLKKRPGERYRRSTTVRPMPEQLLADAGGDRDEAIRLLERFGYLNAGSVRHREKAPAREVERAATPERPRQKTQEEPPRRPAVPDEARPYHRDLNGIEDLAHAVEDEQPPADRIRLGGMSAMTELVTLQDGTRVIRKQTRPELGVTQDGAAEHMAFLVARALGLRAPGVYRNEPDVVWMEFMDNAVTAEETDPDRAAEARASDDGKVVGLLDVLLFNYDRNAGNWMLTDNGQIIPIDHGVAYGEINEVPEEKHLSFLNDFADQYKGDSNPLTSADIAEVRRRLEELRPDFEHIGRGAWLAYSLRMLDLLEPRAAGTRNLIAGVR